MNKDHFLVASLAHDLKNYMAVIEAVVFNLRDSKLDDDQLYSINLIEHSKDSMLSLLNNTLYWTKSQHDKLILNEDRFNFYNVIRNTVNMFEFNAIQKKVDIFYEINAEIPIFFIGDEIRLKQILINLLSNAIKYTTLSDIKVKACLLEDSIDNISHLELKVIDGGKGMTEEEQQNVFELFHTNNPVDGTGIGLNITKTIIELMGGEINVESSPEGSIFTFDIYLKNA